MHQRGLGEVHGNVLDGADVQRNVLARGAVAARRRANKGTVLIRDGHAQAVDLKFAGIRDVAGTQRGLRAVEPLIQLFQVHGIIHGIHARHVRDGRELLSIHKTAHALRVGGGRHQIGICGLDLLELYQQLVERRVRDLRGVQSIITIRVVVEQVAKLRRALRRFGMGVLLRVLGCGSRSRLLRPSFIVHCQITEQALLLCHACLLGTCFQPLQGTITRE